MIIMIMIITAYRYSQIKVENSRKKNNSNISMDIFKKKLIKATK